MKINQQKPNRHLERLGDDIEVFRAASESSPGTYHYVFRYPDSRGVQCTCRGWQTHRYCWHSQSVPAKPIHKALGAHHCSCGWEGDSLPTHFNDVKIASQSPVVLEETGERVWQATKERLESQRISCPMKGLGCKQHCHTSPCICGSGCDGLD